MADTLRTEKSSWFLERARSLVPVIILVLACLRLCHAAVLWADEDYHLAAALHIAHGAVPYRDFWYDKPPLSAFYYLLIAGNSGFPLRLLDSAYIIFACFLAYLIARDWWGELEGLTAALLLALYTTFYLPSAVIPFAADALMLVPHLAAVYFARRAMPFTAGLCIGVAFLANTKAVFVAAACVIFVWPLVPAFLAGLAVPLGLCTAWAVSIGAFSPYIDQVWTWGFAYTAHAPVEHPVFLGVTRTLNWAGFHALLVLAAIIYFVPFFRTRVLTRDPLQIGAWLIVSFAGVSIGSRFAPHYYFQLLPALTIVAARGITVTFARQGNRVLIAAAMLMLVPLIRFGPRYISLAAETITGRTPNWSDIAMDLDSQEAARQVSQLAQPGDTLFVWGYRPDIYVYTRLPIAGRFWDSQPLTGVPADRHLRASDAILGSETAANREELAKSEPTFIVDGLSPFNPALAPAHYSELSGWFRRYQLVRRTKFCLIYKRRTV